MGYWVIGQEITGYLVIGKEVMGYWVIDLGVMGIGCHRVISQWPKIIGLWVIGSKVMELQGKRS